MDKMVFVHDDNCFPNQFACLNERHLAFDDQITPYSEDCVYGVAAAERLASGNNSPSDNDKKRPSDNELCLQASKRPKQVDQHLQSSSFEEICTSAAQLSPGVFEDSKDHQLIVESEEFATEAKNHCFAQELPVRLPFCPGSSGYACRASEFDLSEEILSPLYYGFSRKRVAIGDDHQADIPAWRPCEFKNQLRDSENCVSQWTSITTSSCDDFETDSNKWLGTQVMPMPDTSLLALDGAALHHKVDCSCIDDDSIRCMRQHVTRSREMIKQDIGLERFEQLGFCDMGEVVAQSWTEEEEQLFAEIVSLNSASQGNNFWIKMLLYFPNKSSEELVSYYFNVFMLRRRAVQNRLDPLHVDSDNEELQENDDGEEFVSEEDSVESPVSAEEDDVADDEDLDEMETIEEVDFIENHHRYERYERTDDEKYSCGDVKGYIDTEESTFATGSKLPPSVDYDIQDESCTSFEGQHNGSGFEDPISSFPLEDMNLVYKDDRIEGILEGHGDLRAWGKTYSGGGSEKDEFLSTVKVIEEVFGKADM